MTKPRKNIHSLLTSSFCCFRFSRGYTKYRFRENLFLSLLLFFQWSCVIVDSRLAKIASPEDCTNKKRSLPDHVLIGYVANFDQKDKIVKAVEDGVNVLIWKFFNYNEETGEIDQPKVSKAVNIIQHALNNYDLIHLTSFGGWNGPHLPSNKSAQQLYDAWVRFNTETSHGVFDGFDWDLEGNDNIHAKTSVLTNDCIQTMIDMSRLAKCGGYIVGMAPPQSYLDVQSGDEKLLGAPFSNQLNLPPLIHDWHREFHYTGHNAYAPILIQNDAIDFVSIQFYETWSRANYEINHQKVDPSTYLVNYVKDLVSRNQGYHVLCSSDEVPTNQDVSSSSSYPLVSKFIHIPLNKLVFGFANGWALNRKDGGAIFVHPSDVQRAFEIMRHDPDIPLLPRGCMFWCIGTEGEDGVYLAKGLNKIWDSTLEQQSSSKE